MVQPTGTCNPSALLTASLDLTPSELLGAVLKHLQRSGLADLTIQRMAEIMARFTTYLEKGHGLRSVRDIAEEHVEGFVFATTIGRKGRRRPAVATMHLRRSVLRLYFRTAAEMGVPLEDCSGGLVLPERSPFELRALTDDEIALCRSCSLRTPGATHSPAAWALAEASVRTTEIPHIRLSQVDLAHARVWASGSAKAEPRWVRLTGWGQRQLAWRVNAIKGRAGADPLVLWKDGRGAAEPGALCKAVGETLERAGLSHEIDVRPLSIAGWAGAKVFEETGRIDEVARAIGMRSLDRAARLIGWDWNDDRGGIKDAVA